MMSLIAVLLSFGAVYAYIPVIVIVILIAAAAGLSRGTDIFAIFGVGALLGSGFVNRRGAGFGGAFKTKNDRASRKSAASMMTGGINKKLGAKIAAFRAGRNKLPPLHPRLNVGAGLGPAPGMPRVAGKGVAFPKNYAGPNGVLGKGATAAAAGNKMWATKMTPGKYLISSTIAPGKKWKGKDVIRPGSSEASLDMLEFKANPKNLQDNIKNAHGRKEARIYANEQKAAWNELIRRGADEKGDEKARTAVMGLLHTYGLEHPRLHRDVYAYAGQMSAYKSAIGNLQDEYKGKSLSERKGLSGKQNVKDLWEKLDKNSWSGFIKSSKESAAKADKDVDITLTGSGWKSYYKETHSGKNKVRSSSPSSSEGEAGGNKGKRIRPEWPGAAPGPSGPAGSSGSAGPTKANPENNQAGGNAAENGNKGKKKKKKP